MFRGFLKNIVRKRHSRPILIEVSGSDFEMGFKLGKKTRSQIQKCMGIFFESATKSSFKTRNKEIAFLDHVREIWSAQKSWLPSTYMRRLEGMADGAKVSLEQLGIYNGVGELMKCGSFSLCSPLTEDGVLYHGRHIDLNFRWGIQHGVNLVHWRPQNGIPTVTVGVCGILGSTTASNNFGISICAVGARPEEEVDWLEGCPHQVILQSTLESTNTLDDAVESILKAPRTGNFYYLITDARLQRSITVGGHKGEPQIFEWGPPHRKFDFDGAHFLQNTEKMAYYEKVVEKALSAGKKISRTEVLSLFKSKESVVPQQNIFNVIFVPEYREVWLATAASKAQSAWTQTLYRTDLSHFYRCDFSNRDHVQNQKQFLNKQKDAPRSSQNLYL